LVFALISDARHILGILTAVQFSVLDVQKFLIWIYIPLTEVDGRPA